MRYAVGGRDRMTYALVFAASVAKLELRGLPSFLPFFLTSNAGISDEPFNHLPRTHGRIGDKTSFTALRRK